MIVDAFLYFNEKELADLRVKYLYDIVDCFVVIEADVTHQGKKKEWNFTNVLNGNLKKFSSKIQYHQINIDMKEAETSEGWINSHSRGGRSWKIENMQRNYIREACKKFSKDDIIIISDADEIPLKNRLEFIKNCDFRKIAPVGLEQFLFHMNCNYLNLERWVGSVVTTKEIIDKFKPQDLRNNREKISMFIQSGWSFSSFGGVERVQEKIEAFAHEEYNKDSFKNTEHLKKCSESGLDLFKRNIKKRKINKNFFPDDLLEIMMKNKNFYFN